MDLARRSRFIAVGFLCSLVLAACSGNNSTNDDTGGASGAVATATGGSTGSGGVVDVSACQAVGAAFGSAAAAASAAMSGDTSQLQDALTQFQGYADQVPDEVKGDLSTVADGYQRFIQAVGDSGYDSSSGQPPTANQLAAITAAGAILNEPEFKTASDNLSAWVQDNCG